MTDEQARQITALLRTAENYLARVDYLLGVQDREAAALQLLHVVETCLKAAVVADGRGTLEQIQDEAWEKTLDPIGFTMGRLRESCPHEPYLYENVKQVKGWVETLRASVSDN